MSVWLCGTGMGRATGRVPRVAGDGLVPKLGRGELILVICCELAEPEFIERMERRVVERRNKAAKFPTVKCLKSFDFAAFAILEQIPPYSAAAAPWPASGRNE